MQKKAQLWKTKGMNKDLSVSAFNPEFTFDNLNLRLSTQEGNTFMSWVNEKGPEKIKVYDEDNTQNEVEYPIIGMPVGTAVLDKYLVVFSTTRTFEGSKGCLDSIYRFGYFIKNGVLSMYRKELFRGNLNFITSSPIETLVSYESNHIQKVYWTDGRNQPRLINIVADENKIERWNAVGIDTVCTYFDFVPTIDFKESLTVTNRPASGGTFAPGVIQYCFTYFNRYGQQSNIVDVSPLHYLSRGDSGASPEDKVTNTFKIEINSPDTNFEYVRLYSIQRSAVDGSPAVKVLEDIPIPTASIAPEKTYGTLSGVLQPCDQAGLISGVTNGSSYTIIIPPAQDPPGVPIYPDDKFLLVTKTVSPSNPPSTVVEAHTIPVDGGYLTLQRLLTDIASSYVPTAYSAGTYYAQFSYSQELVDFVWSTYLEGTSPGYDKKDVVNYGIGTIKDSASYNYLPSGALICDYKKLDTEEEAWSWGYGEPIVEVVSSDITYVDDGTTGYTVDPFELLYAGGKEITALTMVDKDNTLFLGNIEQKNTLVNDIQEYFDTNRGDISIEFKEDEEGTAVPVKTLHLNKATGIYSYDMQLTKSHRDISTFKGGETYRFGFQLQKETGEWLEPIFLNDATNPLYPGTALYSENIRLPYAEYSLPVYVANKIDLTSYKRVRPVIVYPTISDRTIMCQGVINPTVFNAQDRKDNSPFAQASWFFRPYKATTKETTTTDISTSITIETKTSGSPTVGTGTPMYIIVGGVRADYYNTLMTNGYLTVLETRTWDYHERRVPFRGTIDIQEDVVIDGQAYKYIAFFSTTQWDAPNSLRHYRDLIDASVIMDNGSPYTVNIDSNKFAVSYGLYYYEKQNSSDPDSTTLEFYYSNVSQRSYKKATFSDISPTLQDNSSGSPIRYIHYDSIYTAKEADYDRANSKKVEIQGSENIYTSPFDTDTKDESKKSNSQFIIDQSIITLNSPDIEFDTETQIYGGENYGLRIIGAIPLTANASSHAFTTDSPMVETYHHKSDESLPAGIVCFGAGELGLNSVYQNYSLSAGSRLVSEYLWEDTFIRRNTEETDNYFESYEKVKFLVYPWQRSGSMGNDCRPNDKVSSLLKTKKEAMLLYSHNTEYFSTGTKGDAEEYPELTCKTHLTEDNNIYTIRLPKQQDSAPDINYYPNIDKVIYSSEDYYDMFQEAVPVQEQVSGVTKTVVKYRPLYDGTNLIAADRTSAPISMKYGSTAHAVIALNAIIETEGSDESAVSKMVIPIMPYGTYSNNDIGRYGTGNGIYKGKTFWGDSVEFSQEGISLTDHFNGSPFDWLWLGEIYKKEVLKRFGGTSKDALKANRWLVAGDAVDIHSNDTTVTLRWLDGDTYYQRYDCLKTYAYTNDDPNQIVEILSFMCETHTNIDGRYDRNRGQLKNVNMHPKNFNLLNPVYSQKDNFFSSKKSGSDDLESTKYPNNVYYTKTKTSGADVDLYTNVTLGSVLELDGDKGKLSSLQKFNNQLFAFQDTGIAQVLYNENVQVSATSGIPIEIANSGKVQGKRYLSNTVGCSNKWSIANTPTGIYFMDSNNKSIYLFNGQLADISVSGGFSSWCNQHIPSPDNIWDPYYFKSFVTYYDRMNKDVLFINSTKALAWNEKIAAFTSFYSYGGIPYFNNLQDTGVWSIGTTVLNTEVVDGSYYYSEQPEHLTGPYCFKVSYRFRREEDEYPQFKTIYSGSANSFYYLHVNGSSGTAGPSESGPYSLEELGETIVTNNDGWIDNGDFLLIYPENYRIQKEYLAFLVENSEGALDNTGLYRHQAGEYNNFFGTVQPYSMTLVGNPEPQIDKIYSDLQLRANVQGDGIDRSSESTSKLTIYFHLPFDSLEVWNDYQHGISALQTKQSLRPMSDKSDSIVSELQRKFRIWNCQIPRNNYPLSGTYPSDTPDDVLGITRFKYRPLERIRNPWVYLKLSRIPKEVETSLPKAELHDISLEYFS